MQGLDTSLLAIENLRYKLYPGPGYQIMLRIIYYYLRARAREPSSLLTLVGFLGVYKGKHFPYDAIVAKFQQERPRRLRESVMHPAGRGRTGRHDRVDQRPAA